jgi:hypothetical protein
MLLRYIFKHIRRSALTNALFCLLLALAGALLALSAGLWYSVYRSELALERNITTIAVTDTLAISRYAERNAWLHDYYNPEIVVRVDPIHKQKEIYDFIGRNVYQSGQVRLDDRRVYGAYAQGMQSVPYRLVEADTTGVYARYLESSPQSAAAFVVFCESTEETYHVNFDEEAGKYRLMRSTLARFTVEQNVYLHSGRYSTRTVTGYFPYSNPDGSAPVVEGKRYLIAGTRYNQGSYSPTWYNAFPGKDIANGLYMDILGDRYDIVEVGTLSDLGDIDQDVNVLLQRNYGVTAGDLPLAIAARAPVYDDALSYEGCTWFELDGSLEDALASDRGADIRTALSVAEATYNSVSVITTDDLNSFLRFNQRIARIVEGRAFRADEIEGGSRVCVISGQLAELNGFAVGDSIALRIYPTFLSRTDSAWHPNPYHPYLAMTEPTEYRIVGIYSGPTQEMNDNAISPNTVIIPASSFSGIESDALGGLEARSANSLLADVFGRNAGSTTVGGESLQPGVGQPPPTIRYAPPVLDTIIIPNGSLDEAKAQIETMAGWCAPFFRYYDQGYATLKPVLANLRVSLAWVLCLSAVGWVVALVMFSLFYIGRKRKETSLLSGIGVGRAECALWVFAQGALVVALSCCIVIGVSLPLYGDVLDESVSASREYTDSLRDYTLSDAETVGVQLILPVEKEPAGVFAAAVGELVLLLAVSALLSLRVSKRRSLSERKEVG